MVEMIINRANSLFVMISALLLLHYCVEMQVAAVELNQTQFQEQRELVKQTQKSHTKFIDDYDEEKEEYKTEADKKDEEA
jgi:DNA phosphorothioation-dependent restriction protein DptG